MAVSLFDVMCVLMSAEAINLSSGKPFEESAEDKKEQKTEETTS